MTLTQGSRLSLLVCTWLYFATLIAARGHRNHTHNEGHEARQGTISVQTLSTPGPSPVDSTIFSQTTDTSPPQTTTMAPPVTTLSASPEPLSSVNPTTSSLETPPPVTVTSASPQPSPTSTTPQASSSSSAPQPSTSPTSLDFTVSNMTTCTMASIAWDYSGDGGELVLSITNIGVSQDDTALVKTKTIQQELANTSASAPSWTWNSVNVSQGWYQIEGLVLTPMLRNNSSPFFVTNGTDVSCLVATSTHSSSVPSATATSPSSSTGSKSNVNLGGIVGGVVGGVSALFLVIIAGVCWSKRRQRVMAAAAEKQERQWGSLKSSVSSMQPGDNRTATNPFQDNSELTGAVLQDTAGGNECVSAVTTSGESNEHEEKLVPPVLYSGMSPTDALNTPLHYDRRASTYSSTNSMQIPTTATSENFRTRVPSMQSAPSQSLEQQAQRIRSSMETSNRRRGERLSMPSIHPIPAQSPTHTQPTEEYPLTPMTPTSVNRTISAGAAPAMGRRASRKPVPQYDSSTLVESRHTDSVSTLSEGPESSQSHGAGLGPGVHGKPSDSLHKTTLGDGRPVHYLMPDMPSAQLD